MKDEVLWRHTCTCGAALAVVVVGGKLEPIKKLYRSVRCNKCGTPYYL